MEHTVFSGLKRLSYREIDFGIVLAHFAIQTSLGVHFKLVSVIADCFPLNTTADSSFLREDRTKWKGNKNVT